MVKECSAEFRLVPIEDEDIYTFAGVISCGAQDCSAGGVVYGGSNSSEEKAVARTKHSARMEMLFECAAWKADRSRVGEPIPDERLPESLRTKPQTSLDTV